MIVNKEGRELIHWLREEYEPYETYTAAKDYCQAKIRRQVNANQFSALVAFLMRIGLDAFIETGIIKKINAGFHLMPENLHVITDIFLMFQHSDDEHGQRLIDPFLVRQGELERDLFLKICALPKRRRSRGNV